MIIVGQFLHDDFFDKRSEPNYAAFTFEFNGRWWQR
jgi:hypothetical protein